MVSHACDTDRSSFQTIMSRLLFFVDSRAENEAKEEQEKMTPDAKKQCCDHARIRVATLDDGHREAF